MQEKSIPEKVSDLGLDGVNLGDLDFSQLTTNWRTKIQCE